ncbi:MAG TPA: YciI family protein, partial [Bryobacteraceae bacterium]|nr:YciI family protein [Bryobacteraceae bacterium]
MLLYKPGFEDAAPPTPENMAAVGELIGEMVEAGVLLATDGLLPSSLGARIQIENGGFRVTDGPFAESKELIGGFAIV